jgi:transcriptional regulator with XRE-family HTH domain
MSPQEVFQSMIAGLEDRGLSRTQIAEEAGLSRATVWRLATGEAREPSWQTIDALRNIEKRIATDLPMKQL